MAYANPTHQYPKRQYSGPPAPMQASNPMPGVWAPLKQDGQMQGYGQMGNPNQYGQGVGGQNQGMRASGQYSNPQPFAYPMPLNQPNPMPAQNYNPQNFAFQPANPPAAPAFNSGMPNFSNQQPPNPPYSAPNPIGMPAYNAAVPPAMPAYNPAFPPAMPAYNPTYPPAMPAYNPAPMPGYNSNYQGVLPSPIIHIVAQGYPPNPIVHTVAQGYPSPFVNTVAPGYPSPVVNTIKPNAGYPGGPIPGMPKPGPIAAAKPGQGFAVSIPAVKVQPVKPVAVVQCDGGQHQVPDVEIYPKKCFDPNHSVCYKCLYTAYLAQESPICPYCKREYSDNELAEIHQLMLFSEYSNQAGQTPKKSGAGTRVMCSFGHDTHKDTIIPNVCPNRCVVCKPHYQTVTHCICGQPLGMQDFPHDIPNLPPN